MQSDSQYCPNISGTMKSLSLACNFLLVFFPFCVKNFVINCLGHFIKLIFGMECGPLFGLCFIA